MQAALGKSEGRTSDTNTANATGKAAKEVGKGKVDRSTEMTPTEGEEKEEEDPGYNPTLEDLRLREVYRDWVHANPGTHLDGSIRDNSVW